MKTFSVGVVALGVALAVPAMANDQSPSQADYDCANYGECAGTTSVSNQEEGSVVVESTRGMNIAGRLGKKVTEATASRPVAPKVVGVRAKAETAATSSARARVTAPSTVARPIAATAASTRLKLAQGITFMSGSADLTPAARMNVDKMAASLMRHDKLETRFRIEGHTDAVGEATANQILSERRAAAVVNYLVAKGVDRTRLEIAGYGESDLLDGVAPNASSNRRVVSKLLN